MGVVIEIGVGYSMREARLGYTVVGSDLHHVRTSGCGCGFEI